MGERGRLQRLTDDSAIEGIATGRWGGPVLCSFFGGSKDGVPLLGPARRSGELVDRFAGMVVGNDWASCECGVREVDACGGDGSATGWGVSTGTAVTGKRTTSERWV